MESLSLLLRTLPLGLGRRGGGMEKGRRGRALREIGGTRYEARCKEMTESLFCGSFAGNERGMGGRGW